MRFAIQNLEFYEWKFGDHGWALSWHRTHTLFALWPDVTSCLTYEKTESEEVFSIVSYIRSKICNSIGEFTIPLEYVSLWEGFSEHCGCHLFVVRVPERSAVCSQALCAVSGEASATKFRTSVTESFLFRFSPTSHRRLANYKAFPMVYLFSKSDKNWLQTKPAKQA